jgi:hypothetical protein
VDYATLTADKSTGGSIKSWMNYSKIDPGSILEEAQTMIYERLRVREMATADTFPVRVGDDAIDVPDNFLAQIMLKDITNDCELDYRDQTDLERMRTWTDGALDEGDPAYFAVFDEMFQFNAKTRTAWTLRASFYQQPDLLSSSRRTNFLTKKYPHMLRMACLATGARFNDDDEKFAREQRLLFAAIDSVNVEDEMSRSTYVPVSM